MKNILIALDYGPSAIAVATKGKELAAQLGAKVILLHVVAEASYYSSLNYSPITGFDSFSSMDILQEDTVEEVRKAAGAFLERFSQNISLPDAERVVGSGDFADEILRVAVEKQADVVVLGSHSRKGFEKILVGSVAQKVLRKSELPLFIVPIRNS
ncbi:MAG: universal stress protein [Chitinophagaceae bacterium]|nr:universal stress protein [Chitinophagaceae bacterium]MCW5914634.1 universal stress protein [Chitinophagaceae bacterium]